MPRPGRTAIIAAAAALLGAALAAAVWQFRDPDGSRSVATAMPQILFDDFGESSGPALAAGGWLVRSAPGEPGIPGAGWARISLAGDPGVPDGRLLRLTATTDGTVGGTTQAQICHRAKYREGTSAARVRLRDGPVSGPRVDRPTEAFSAVGRFAGTRGEFAFEYRPVGTRPVLDVLAPGGESRSLAGSRKGWHVLLAQVAEDEVAYFVDGSRVAIRRGRPHGGAAAIVLGLWFEAVMPGPARRYVMDVDWVFHQADAVIAPVDVAGAVASLRRIGIGFQDSVESGPERAGSPCAPA
jgi:hypothetical protein